MCLPPRNVFEDKSIMHSDFFFTFIASLIGQKKAFKFAFECTIVIDSEFLILTGILLENM